MIRSLRRFILTGALLVPWVAQAENYTVVDPSASAVTFTYTQMGVSLEGKFPTFDATISYDPAAPGAASTSITVPLAPIDTGTAEGDEEVQGKDWFASATHPTASFTATAVTEEGPGKLAVTGTLTIKGQSRVVTVPVTVTETGGKASFDGTLKINRTDFGVGAGLWADPEVVAHEVTIAFHLVATAAPH